MRSKRNFNHTILTRSDIHTIGCAYQLVVNIELCLVGVSLLCHRVNVCNLHRSCVNIVHLSLCREYRRSECPCVSIGIERSTYKVVDLTLSGSDTDVPRTGRNIVNNETCRLIFHVLLSGKF